MSSVPGPSHYTKSVVDIPRWQKQLLGLTPDAPEFSPYKAMARQASDLSRIYEGVTTRPTQAAKEAYYGVPTGTDLTPYIEASRSGVPVSTILARQGSSGGSSTGTDTKSSTEQKAAAGGLMSLRKFAGGGSSGSKPSYKPNSTAEQKAQAIYSAINTGYKPTPAETKFMQGYTDSQAVVKAGVKGTIDPKTGMMSPNPRGATQSTEEYKKYLNQFAGAGGTLPPNIASQYKIDQTIPKGAGGSGDSTSPIFTPSGNEFNVSNYDPTQAGGRYGGITGDMGKATIDAIYGLQNAPSQFGEATTAYKDAIAGLKGLTNYSPKDVSSDPIVAQMAAAQQGSASIANRGDVRDIAAQMAQVDKYQASQMRAPQDIQAQGYDAALAQTNQMQRPEDVTARDMQAAQMRQPGDVTTNPLQYFQMQGPGSWTDEGVSQKYMDPYKQGVIDIAKREKGKDYQNQLNALNHKAISAGAFGGGRQAMERSQASKDYQQQLQDLEVQGLSQAYQSGMGQYGAESGLGQQANIQNLQALLGVQQTGSTQDLQAQLANQQTAFATGQANMTAEQQANLTNVQNALQASLANQQAGLTTGQANLGAAQQTSIANQNAINSQRQQYVAQALQAAQTNYGGQLTAEQQNMIAQNAASQFNSQSQNLAYNNYTAQGLAAQQANQGIDAQLAALNAQLGTNVSMNNAQLGTSASINNSQVGTQANTASARNALEAMIQNQQAGLTANSQNIGAFNQIAQAGQGLGALGTAQGNYNLNSVGMMGNMWNTADAKSQAALEAARKNAGLAYAAIPNANKGVVDLLAGTGAKTGAGTTNTFQ